MELKAVRASKSSLMEIPLGLIDRPQVLDRLEIDEEELEELAQSIRENGLLSPIRVNEENGRYRIIFGDRRYLAHQKLEAKTIRAFVVNVAEKQVSLERATENLGRRDLSPLEQAFTFKRLIDDHGLTAEQVGKKVGVSGGVVKRRMSLLKMDGKIQQAVHVGKISITIAEEITSCPDATHRDYLLALAIEHGVTMLVMRGWVDDYRRSLSEISGGTVDGGGVRFPGSVEPLYRACQLCKGAVDISSMVRIECCGECAKAVMDIVHGKGG